MRKKIKEISLSVDTSKYSSPHVKPKIPYLSGFSGGMDNSAASKYSSYINSKKYANEEEDNDDPLIEEEEMKENILKLRVKTHKGYSLNETLEQIQSEILKESVIGDKIHSFLKVALMSLLDDATGEASGLILALPILYKNVYELNSQNNKLEALIRSNSKDTKEYMKIRQNLSKDLKDILEALIIALPIPGIDSIVASVVSLLSPDLIGSSTYLITDKFKELSQKSPIVAKILYILGYPLGAPVIFTAMKNIDRLSDAMLATTMSGATIVSDLDDSRFEDIEDVTPTDMTEMLDYRIYDILNETLTVDEGDYYGVDEMEEDSLEEIGGYALPLGASNKPAHEQDDHHVIAEETRKFQAWQLKTLGRIR
jgi:hypothetical protein